MLTVFIAGSIGIKQLEPAVRQRLMNVLALEYHIVIGDADGVDVAAQRFLAEAAAAQLVVYCSGETARNNIGNWPVQAIHTSHPIGSRAFFTAKDMAMAAVADYGLMIWDGNSPGTLSNIIALLMRKKASLVFMNSTKTFKKITALPGLEELLAAMPDEARSKANSSIKLAERLDLLRTLEKQMPIF